MEKETQELGMERILLNCKQMAMCTLGGPGSLWNSKAFSSSANRSLLPISTNLPISPPYSMQTGVPLHRKPQELPFDFQFKIPLPVQPYQPIFFKADLESESSIASYTEIEGRRVACFNIGGEDRLSLPPILNSILKEIDISDTNEACDILQIYISRCSLNQLQQLKELKILPNHIFTSGLIRKTDAERLCTLLLHTENSKVVDPDDRKYPQINDCCFPVYHECFGEGHGFLYSELYTDPTSRCIACADCEQMFTPERFIAHSHYNRENQICHWGFDRSRWRSYLLLSEDEIDDSVLDRIQRAFNSTVYRFKNSRQRRKVSDEDDVVHHGKSHEKTQLMRSSQQPAIQLPTKRRCLRPPMRASGYDENGKPVLDDPDRVVSLADSHLYGEHFVPNVSLKPSDKSCGGGSEACGTADGSKALDLRSPTQKKLSSESHATDTAAVVAADDDFVDVISTEGCDSKSTHTGEESKHTDKVARDNELSVKRYLQNMQEIFTQVLEKTDFAAGEKEAKLNQYKSLCEGIERTV